MPNELNIALANSGLTVTAQRYQSGAAVGSAISLSEISASGVYTGNMTGSAGTYQLAFISAGKNVGSGQIVWDGTNEVLTTPSTIRTEMDTNSTKLANLNATVSSRLAGSAYTAPTTPPTAAAVATQVRTELGTELGRIDAAISSRATPANIPSADITAIKAKTDALNTDRLAQCATTSIVGGLLAQANS